jgi:hypothetical protein
MLFSKTSSFALVAALALTGLGGRPADADTAIPGKILTPTKAQSFEIGSKHALAFYQAEKNACKVTVILSDRFDEKAVTYTVALHFKAKVASGSAARVDTTDGRTLSFTCTTGASTLIVQAPEHVALKAPVDSLNGKLWHF